MSLSLVSSNDDDEIEYTTLLTARRRELLATMLSTLADDMYDDVENFGGRPLTDADDAQALDLLPELTWTQDWTWRRQMARAFDDLAEDLIGERLPLPTCTAEEMALHLAIDQAQSLQSDGQVKHIVEHLPEQPADRNWDGLRQDLFEDHDVLLMFEMTAMPSEHDQYQLLRPENWFAPFEGGRPADRGFRR